jgi:hypothetical protein
MAFKLIGGKLRGSIGDVLIRIKNVTGIALGANPSAHIRKESFISEEYRHEAPYDGYIEMESFPISKEAADKIIAILYKEWKKMKKVTGVNITPAVIDEESGEETTPEVREDIIEQPYAEMEDVIES